MNELISKIIASIVDQLEENSAEFMDGCNLDIRINVRKGYLTMVDIDAIDAEGERIK